MASVCRWVSALPATRLKYRPPNLEISVYQHTYLNRCRAKPSIKQENLFFARVSFANLLSLFIFYLILIECLPSPISYTATYCSP